MKLDLQQIRAISLGAEEVLREADGFRFHRFSREQRELYRDTNEDFYRKCFATSGIQLRFATDSEKLKLDINVSTGSSRSYFSVDVFTDDALLGCIDNLRDDLPQDYTEAVLPLGDYSKVFHLGKGMKTVCVCLPWSVSTVIRNLEVDDGACITPVKPKHKLLAFGDSITQGYDAQRPSNKYITRLAQLLDAEECNKAIGGEQFYPSLAQKESGSTPDYIVVAYGTNDWSHSTRQELINSSRAFYAALSSRYPQARIFAMTPIWRLDFEMEKPVGPFCDVEKIITDGVKDLENVTVIRCFDMVPKDTAFFADLRLHPNDAGFGCYFEGLRERISRELALQP